MKYAPTLLALARNVSFAAIFTFSSSAHAVFFNNAAGLANPQQTITFESVMLSTNQPITTEFQGLGATFSNAFGNPDPSNSYPNVSGNRIGNFQSNVNQSGLFSVNFTSDLSEVAFAMVSQTGTSTFQALLNGSLVETATRLTSATDSVNYYGFRDIVFNQVTISVLSNDRALMVDNLQTVTSVPEPESWTLLLAGVTLVSVAARRVR